MNADGWWVFDDDPAPLSDADAVAAVRKLHAPDVNTSPFGERRWVKCAHCKETIEGESAEMYWPCDTAKIVYSAQEIRDVLHPPDADQR